MRIVPEQVARFVPSRLFVPLGTDGFGRSDTREQLRSFFEIDRHHVVIATLRALADDGAVPAAKVAEAIAKYEVDVDRPDPWTV
jgi:pyruvate dehydrogenase E1 component